MYDWYFGRIVPWIPPYCLCLTPHFGGIKRHQKFSHSKVTWKRQVTVSGRQKATKPTHLKSVIFSPTKNTDNKKACRNSGRLIVIQRSQPHTSAHRGLVYRSSVRSDWSGNSIAFNTPSSTAFTGVGRSSRTPVAPVILPMLSFISVAR